MLTANALPVLSRWISPLYLAGVACILGRLVFGVWGGHRLRRMAIPIEDETLLASFRKLAYRVGLKVVPTVAWCEQISVPVVVGIVKPMILLPMAAVSNLAPDQLQALMLHELSHIRRYDPIVNLLQRIVEAVLFFHPAVWFVSRRISIEREHAADDMVLAAGWDRPLYADALLRMAELATSFSGSSGAKRAAVLAATGTNPSEFKLRILRLLDASRPPKFALSRTSILLVLSFILMGAVFAWSQTHPREAAGEIVDATAADPTPPPEQQPIPTEMEPRQKNTAPPKSLEFLKAYPALHALSLDMTESQFLEIVKREKLTATKAGEGDKTQHHIALGDGHTLIVMFDKAGEKCRGIQRVRGENTAPVLRTLRKPALLLPDHWTVMSVGFDNDGKELVTASTQSFVTIRRWDVVGKNLISEIKLEGDKHGRQFREATLMLSGNRRRVIAATDEYVGIWDTATGELLKKLPFPTREGIYDCWIDKLDCTPDLSVIAGNWAMPGRLTLAYDARVMIWDGDSGNLLQTVIDKGATVLHSIDLSTDGKRLATTNGGGARIWDTSTGQQLLHVPNDNKGRKHPDPEVAGQYNDHVWSVQLSPDGKQLAVGDILGVRLWDVPSGKLLQQLEGPHRYGLGSLVFSKDGRLLARMGTGDRAEGDKTSYVVPIWSTQTGQKLFELHTESNEGEFSDDGQRLAIGFSDRQMALSVWLLSGGAADPGQTEGPGPDSRQDKVEENGHYHGKKAADFIDKFQPTWGDAKLGIQYGIALTKPQQQFRNGERVPLVVFFRNTSDRLLKIDMRPDFFGHTPKVVDAKGAAVEFANVPLLGHIPHYVENLEPGEAVGPFYLNFGLGENPRPGKRHWHPYYKVPLAGKYQLTHAVALEVKDGDKAKNAEVTTGTVAFEVVEGGKPADQGPEDKSGAAPPTERSSGKPEDLRDEGVEASVFATVRTPFDYDPAKGSWQGGAYDAQVLLTLGMVRQQDRVVKALIKIVDRSEPSSVDQRRLAMVFLGGRAPQEVVALLIRELEAAVRTPKETFAPYHEISVLGLIGEEARDAIPVLVKLLDFPDGLAAQESLLALVQIGPSSTLVMNEIAKRMGDPDKQVWSRAVYEVGRYGQLAKPLGPTFIKLLDCKSKEAQTWAAQALIKSRYDEARGFDELLNRVAKGVPEDRSLAATALAALGSQASSMVDKLRPYEHDPDPHVAKEVRQAILRIEKDDRIFTHAEVAAKNAAARKSNKP
ncbi:MAG TPA: M56 family metallopeptidase [Pirellulaceae bacterium]|nr:M56 family metallopeptidase [Pirellulaceae bacterium]